ncbi:MAG: hypothetical protein MK052_09510 [Alphaproteobacteria bacterium]|nr:hypothetical protein [Alphaproteobacteria bacterium]
MIKLPALIVIIALLALNAISTAHAGMHGGALCDGVQAESLHDCHGHGSGADESDSHKESCDCAACGHHHHSHATLLPAKANPAPSFAKMMYRSFGVIYLSQRHYPPSKPPKA